MFGQRRRTASNFAWIDGRQDAAEPEQDAALQAFGEPGHQGERGFAADQAEIADHPGPAALAPRAAPAPARTSDEIEGCSLFSSRNQSPRYFWTAS